MNREWTLQVVLVVVGLIMLFAVYPLRDVLVAERLALAAESSRI